VSNQRGFGFSIRSLSTNLSPIFGPRWLRGRTAVVVPRVMLLALLEAVYATVRPLPATMLPLAFPGLGFADPGTGYGEGGVDGAARHGRDAVRPGLARDGVL
jgi:hypothetical protein